MSSQNVLMINLFQHEFMPPVGAVEVAGKKRPRSPKKKLSEADERKMRVKAFRGQVAFPFDSNTSIGQFLDALRARLEYYVRVGVSEGSRPIELISVTAIGGNSHQTNGGLSSDLLRILNQKRLLSEVRGWSQLECVFRLVPKKEIDKVRQERMGTKRVMSCTSSPLDMPDSQHYVDVTITVPEEGIRRSYRRRWSSNATVQDIIYDIEVDMHKISQLDENMNVSDTNNMVFKYDSIFQDADRKRQQRGLGPFSWDRMRITRVRDEVSDTAVFPCDLLRTLLWRKCRLEFQFNRVNSSLDSLSNMVPLEVIHTNVDDVPLMRPRRKSRSADIGPTQYQFTDEEMRQGERQKSDSCAMEEDDGDDAGFVEEPEENEDDVHEGAWRARAQAHQRVMMSQGIGFTTEDMFGEGSALAARQSVADPSLQDLFLDDLSDGDGDTGLDEGDNVAAHWYDDAGSAGGGYGRLRLGSGKTDGTSVRSE